MKTIIAAIIMLVCIIFVGNMDYDDAVLEEENYCKMVADGIHPAYKPEIDCNVH